MTQQMWIDNMKIIVDPKDGKSLKEEVGTYFRKCKKRQRMHQAKTKNGFPKGWGGQKRAIRREDARH